MDRCFSAQAYSNTRVIIAGIETGPASLRNPAGAEATFRVTDRPAEVASPWGALLYDKYQ